MKLSELKHNHSLTDLLKILLFSILMLAPIGMVAVRCGYVMFNKNAYQSYSGYNIETNTELATSIESGLDYQIIYTNYTGNATMDNPVGVENLNVESQYANFNTWYANNKDNIKYIRFQYYNNNERFFLYDENLTMLDNWGTAYSQTFKVTFTALNNTTVSNNDLFYRVYQQQVGNSLDNVFEYSVSQLEESSLFNWTENTAIFSGIQTMSTQLGITNQTIPILITYWFLLTVIYVIIDIILKLFTYMTHALSSRKA